MNKVAAVEKIHVGATSSTAATMTTMFANTGMVALGSPATKMSVVAKTGVNAKDVQNAVYGHLQAVRALGRTEVTSDEVAQALRLPRATVEKAFRSLASKGVKIS